MTSRTLRRASVGAFLVALALAGCGGHSEAPAVVSKATRWTDQPFPESGRADVRAYYEQIEQAVAAGSVVTLPTIKIDTFLGNDDFGEPQDLQLRLTRSKLLDPDAFFEVNGLPAEGPFIRTYEGHVEGMPNNLAHVMVSQDFIRGAVRIGDTMNVIRIAMKGNRPLDMPRRRTAPEAQPVDRPPVSATPSACPDDGIPANAGLRAVPPYLSPVNGLGFADAPELRARVILDSDYRAAERWGRHLVPMMVGMFIEMDLTYRYEVGVRHTLVGLHQNLLKDYFPDPEQRDPFAELSRWWDGWHLERDVLHFFTGWDSSYAQANCIGGSGTTAGYSFSSISWEEEYAYFHQNAFAHEFGHLYSAHHHYGNHVESDLGTIMIQGYTPGAQPQFSSLSRTVIRGWAEEYLLPWP